MTRYLLSFGIFFGVSTEKMLCQSLQPIQLDRPDQTECPYITPAKYIQIENGFSYTGIDRGKEIFNSPSSLWKYGINEKLELRVITELLTEKTENKSETGILPVTFGFKTSLWEENGFIPKTSFIGHVTSNTLGTKKFHSTYIAPAFRFVMSHTLSNKLSLSYNLGAEWNGETPENSYIYTLTTGYSLSEKAGCYLEVFGFLPVKDKADHSIDGGFTYLITNDVVADLSGGYGLTNNAPDYYLSLGFSFRFKTFRKQ